jgi:hypothetical protein
VLLLNLEHWSKIIFSDETQVVIGKNKKIYVWRCSHETVMPQCVGQYGDVGFNHA